MTKSYTTSPRQILSGLWSNKELILIMIKREIMGKYRGSFMGISWSFFVPLIMLGVYTFVFSVVFDARWGVTRDESTADFAIMLFAGIIIHSFLSECINRSPGLILSNPNYVKKVVFPLDILPWVAMGTALFQVCVSLTILLAAQLIMHHHLPWTIVFFPIVFFPLMVLTAGVCWLLSSVGVFVRDIGQFTGILTTILLFMSPIFYPSEALPSNLRPLLMLNPLSFIIEEARGVLILGDMPNIIGLMIYMAVALAVAWIGFAWFQKTRKGFADVV